MGQKRALLIGINYIGQSCQLRGCIDDSINIRKLLIEKYKYRPEYILMINDNEIIKPTRENILLGIRWLVSQEKIDQYGKKDLSVLDNSNRASVFFIILGMDHIKQI